MHTNFYLANRAPIMGGFAKGIRVACDKKCPYMIWTEGRYTSRAFK